MARAAGSQTPEWKATEKIQDKWAEFVEKVADNLPKAIDIYIEHLDKADHPQYQLGAANKIFEAYLKLHKELKGKLPGDFVKESVHAGVQKKKPKGAKKEGNGVVAFKMKNTGTEG